MMTLSGLQAPCSQVLCLQQPWPSSPHVRRYPCSASRRNIRLHAVQKAGSATRLESFPGDYNQAIRQAQDATAAAIKDGARLVEVEFPSASLTSTAGDAEGANEMTYCMTHLRQFCRAYQNRAESVRIFFPDQQEMAVARRGKGIDPAAGSWTLDPVFGDTRFALDYLTKPTGLSDMGIDFSALTGFKVGARVQQSDELFIIAYPHFNVGEMVAVAELYETAAKATETPIVVFNGELDRIRSGYYPSLFYPKLGRLAKEFIPAFETAYYIHNFKGSRGGALFRAYPGPWQVLQRDGLDSSRVRCVHTQDTMPSLREVALDILPQSYR